MMKFLWAFSPLFFCLALVAGAQQERYTIEINEKGSKFNEVVEVSEKNGTVVYHVPKHNGVAESHVLVDYKNGISVTRVPELKECYISKIDKNEPSLSDTRINMLLRQSVVRKNVTVPIKTKTDIMIKFRKMNPKNLSRRVLKFCSENRVYLVKHVPIEQFMTNSTSKKGTLMQKRTYTYRLQLTAEGSRLLQMVRRKGLTCQPVSYYLSEISRCAASSGRKQLKYSCGPNSMKTCRYRTTCNPVYSSSISTVRLSAIVDMECQQEHQVSHNWCCDIICI